MIKFSARHEVNDLRKDMDAGFVNMEAKFDALRAELTAIKWGVWIIGAGTVAILVKTFF
ncbi:hypothetical protein CAGGBEG34_230072 [Candidatus Glomeribacter gigasporarum BEG34]|uniref:Phage-related protein n=1 Tax=Candidatus Glomeribacter gigasporarum BEG34 TaxID=1070319 RepID=G2J9I2_9BURK|nr:hypothetical protein [Candidatus Glomeribacter gigasporarum]CCD29429.1 hypothetical protein CAGGBEG34_230072 [Candidatus Glomeribacter gigasporarum BEG34]